MIAATIVLLLLHAPGGREILLNPAHVASLHAAISGKPNEFLTDEVRCVISTTDGKNVNVVESCDEVRTMMEQPR